MIFMKVLEERESRILLTLKKILQKRSFICLNSKLIDKDKKNKQKQELARLGKDEDAQQEAS